MLCLDDVIDDESRLRELREELGLSINTSIFAVRQRAEKIWNMGFNAADQFVGYVEQCEEEGEEADMLWLAQQVSDFNQNSIALDLVGDGIMEGLISILGRHP